MSSDKQNNISELQKSLLCIIVTLLIVIMFMNICNSKHDKKNNVIYVFNDKITENVEDKSNDLEIECDSKLSISDVFTESIINNFNLKINGYAISLNDYTYGYVASLEERYAILNDICRNYIEVLGLNIEDISQISILGKLEATPDKIYISDLKQSGEIADKIYDASLVNDDLLGLQIKVKISESNDIEPTTVIQPTEELYMGQEEIIEGIKGKSMLYKEVTYNGLSKNKESLINEEVIKPPVDTIVKKGTKNPYYDGIAFLSSPTDGGVMTSQYGEARTTSNHSGIDIAKDLGDNVTAALDGRVIKAGYNNGGYGNLIVLQHDNNIQTYYAHLSEIYVDTGDVVNKGELIGAVGSTGYSTGPHLHFELRVDGNPVNPISYIQSK